MTKGAAAGAALLFSMELLSELLVIELNISLVVTAVGAVYAVIHLLFGTHFLFQGDVGSAHTPPAPAPLTPSSCTVPPYSSLFLPIPPYAVRCTCQACDCSAPCRGPPRRLGTCLPELRVRAGPTAPWTPWTRSSGARSSASCAWGSATSYRSLRECRGWGQCRGLIRRGGGGRG
jgi:hypothetical protein